MVVRGEASEMQTKTIEREKYESKVNTNLINACRIEKKTIPIALSEVCVCLAKPFCSLFYSLCASFAAIKICNVEMQNSKYSMNVRSRLLTCQ